MEERQILEVTYRNWRGEIAVRRIIPKLMWFGKTEWHPEEQWLIRAFDVDKQVDRDFALSDMLGTPHAG